MQDSGPALGRVFFPKLTVLTHSEPGAYRVDYEHRSWQMRTHTATQTKDCLHPCIKLEMPLTRNFFSNKKPIVITTTIMKKKSPPGPKACTPHP